MPSSPLRTSLALAVLAVSACGTDGSPGASPDGGRTETGGAPASSGGGNGGGTVGSGGAPGTGGTATGGAPNTGAASNTGGAPSTDAGSGDASAGGRQNDDAGVSSGGSSTGGASGSGGAQATGGSGGKGSSTNITCPPALPTQAFRDDFDGTALDTTKWGAVEQNSGGGGTFTQLTKMLKANVAVSGGLLRVSSRRHCVDPWPARNSDEHPAACDGTNYYSGAWLRTSAGYAAGRGLVAFRAKFPRPVRGIFPALWARNLHGDQFYGEFDLIETWWDVAGKGVASDENRFVVTTWVGTNAQFHTSQNNVGPLPNLVTAFHVFEVEWDASATPATARYYYRDTPEAERVLLRSVTFQTPGLAGNVTESQFETALSDPFRPYIDFAVQPDSAYHVGPDTAPTYDPEDLEVDAVIVCGP